MLKLLEWSWNTFHSIAREVDTSKGGSHLGAMTDLKKLVYISRACLRLLKIYVTEIYPDGGKVFSWGNSVNEEYEGNVFIFG